MAATLLYPFGGGFATGVGVREGVAGEDEFIEKIAFGFQTDPGFSIIYLSRLKPAASPA
jgi:hypothetical protein